VRPVLNPCDGVQHPRPPDAKATGITSTRPEFYSALLPAVEHRAQVATAGMSGLRWGETAGFLPTAMRFHDLRHCYATWLVSDGVPINEVQRLLGHEQASTTLDRYTHASKGHDERVTAVFEPPADFLLSLDVP
jgi:integrase